MRNYAIQRVILLIPTLFVLSIISFSLELAFFSLFLSALVAIPIGVFSAVRQDTKGDYAVRSTVVLVDAVPHFWLATLILILPAVYLGWSVPVGWHSLTEEPVRHFIQMLLPASIISVSSSASLVRITRTMMLEVLRQEYIRTAWSKGLSERSIMYRHALKNALIPVVTVFGLRVPNALNGSVVMEAVFGIPGLGRWTIDAITYRDYGQLQLALMFTAITVLVANLIVDLLYGWLDPRVRYR